MRILQRDFGKTHVITSPKLRCDAKIDYDHVSYFWIPADGLAISQKQNRFAAWWNLDCAGRNRFGNKIGFVLAFQFRTIKTNSHAVGIWRNGEFVLCESLNGYIVESVPICATDETQTWVAACRACPMMRRGP